MLYAINKYSSITDKMDLLGFRRFMIWL